ncbi:MULTISPECIES: SpoIIE family protein phosphatase [Streptomyces]|uniref:PAS sensor protein n=1 Tax=Streptomyces dengpaensis TaxID=2049881 RepID=A0ABN5HV15_9ACTN|nr:MULTISPECIES: SpoIIE family protein phosphatase [Streptomyces]AVH54779.1 PAS sensor protein [Streptomyces dengpaensis]PIA98530.1 PAS sensor protein [Streptomyces sp. HG99]
MSAAPDDGAAQAYGSDPPDAAGSALRVELDRLLDLAVCDTGAHAGAVFLLAPDGQALRLEVTAGMPAEYLAPWLGVGLSSPVPVAEAVRERRLVWLGRPEELARRYPRTAIALPYQFAVAAAPILTGTTAWGALLLFWPCCDTAELADPGSERVGAACRRLGRLLRDAADAGRPVTPGALPRMLPQPPTRTWEPTEALAAAHFAERLPGGSCTLDLEGRFTYLSATAADLLGGSIPDLLGRRPWQALSWSTDPAFEDRFRAAVVSRQPGFFTAMVPPDRWLAFELYPDGSGVSVRIVPADPGRTSTAAPAGTGTPRGEPIPLGELYQVLHLAAALSEAVGVGDVVDLVADEMLPAFHASTLALFAVEDGRLRLIGCRGYNPYPPELFDGATLTSPAAVGTLAGGVPNFFATFEEVVRAYPLAPRQDGLHAWAYLPLIASGRPVGLCVLAFDRPHPFSGSQRTVLTALAGLIAQALERARLYDTAQELAQTLQAALLPDSLPDLPGLDVAARYLPSVRGMDIGGDFYDLVRVDDTTAAAVIGDVQGHNVTAAALMGRCRLTIRSHAAAGATPAQALAQANRRLVDLDPGRFVSCLYVQLDLAHRRAVLATAGHPPPILRHPDGHAEVLRVPPGVLLGIDLEADYPTTEIPLEPGTVLALYTDGLVETPGGDLDDAMAGLAAQLAQARPQPVDQLATALIDHARQTAPRTDDIALLLIRFVTAG